MERFVSSVADPPLRERLLIAIDGKGAFRRFKDVLLAFPAERERWFVYRSEVLHFHIQTWVEHTKIRSPTHHRGVGSSSPRNRSRWRGRCPRERRRGRFCAARRVTFWTKSPPPSCPRHWRSSSSCGIAALAPCCMPSPGRARDRDDELDDRHDNDDEHVDESRTSQPSAVG